MADDATPAQAFQVQATPPGIVRLRWTPGLCITGSLAAAAMIAVDELNGDGERPLLVQMADLDTPTREAREQFGYRCTASRIALLGQSAIDRIHASFAPRQENKGFPVPTRFFTSEATVLAWLLNGTTDA